MTEEKTENTDNDTTTDEPERDPSALWAQMLAPELAPLDDDAFIRTAVLWEMLGLDHGDRTEEVRQEDQQRLDAAMAALGWRPATRPTEGRVGTVWMVGYERGALAPLPSRVDLLRTLKAAQTQMLTQELMLAGVMTRVISGDFDGADVAKEVHDAVHTAQNHSHALGHIIDAISGRERS